ncbi:hypothetical protein HYDPIDRAFT_77143 [Hydnomerulius pinastri MD-312]|nr:hypothetical protein HYDPIDRAFT_77143 [Hydnomerulius pinastri MD-312]
MSRPPVFAEQTASGIAVDPRTLERVIPESKRADGSVRKQLKIRPGFTPQEDVSRFRGTRQQAMDTAALPKGHILGWVAPSSAAQPKAKGAAVPPPNKNAKKRANQRAKKAAEKAEVVKDNWDDEEDAEGSGTGGQTPAQSEATTGKTSNSSTADAANKAHSSDKSDWAAAPSPTEGEGDLADKLSKLNVK